MSRRDLFGAVRLFAPGQKFTVDQVKIIDSLADSFGFPRDDAAPINGFKVHSLRDPAAFFQGVKAVTGSLTQSQVDGLNYLLKAMERWPVEWAAYGLATSYHETAHTFQPIEEIGKGRGRKYGVPGPHGGQVAYGRGHVQLTWPDNYAKADKELGLNGALIKDYRKALDPKIAADILVRGMEEGWFTGKSLKSYELGDYVNDRRIINGTDMAHKIAGYARGFESALNAGGW